MHFPVLIEVFHRDLVFIMVQHGIVISVENIVLRTSVSKNIVTVVIFFIAKEIN